MKNNKQMITAAFFLALGLVLPFITGQIPQFGAMLLPMHIPVLLCGFICGPQYGMLVGFITPLLRYMLFGMPPMPTALSMAFELAAYGCVTGILYRKIKNQKSRIYISLIAAMMIGRVVVAVANVIIYGVGGATYTWQMFLAGAVLNAIPGIILQLVLIPILMFTLEKAGVTEQYDSYFKTAS